MIAILPACDLFCLDSCGCGPSPKPQFGTIQSFDLRTLNPAGFDVDPQVPFSYDNVFKAFEIKDFDLLSFQKNSSQELSGLGMAWACSPPPISCKEKILNILVTNETQVEVENGEIWSAGQDITEAFGITYWGNYAEIEPIDQFLGNGKVITIDDRYKLGLLKDPGKDIHLQLTIQLVLENGIEFSFPGERLTIRTKN